MFKLRYILYIVAFYLVLKAFFWAAETGERRVDQSYRTRHGALAEAAGF